MKIHLPNSAFLGNIDSFLRSYNPSNKNKLEVTSNKKWISVHPVVLSMVVSLGLSVKDGGGTINIRPLEAKSGHYFERMGLFKILGLKSGICVTEHEAAGRFIPITQITNSKDMNKFMTDLIPLLHKEPSHAEAIRHVISELVRNVLEHSESKRGATICAQYHNKTNKIRIGVADGGIGIKTAINQSHPAKNDSEAIELALRPGITGTTRRLGGTEDNAGFGLFIIKSIAKINRDFFTMYTGNVMYKLLRTPHGEKVRIVPNPTADKHRLVNNLPYWEGTVVGIDMSLSEHRDFSHFLSLIRGVYRKDIKEKRKARFKRAKFL